MLVSPFVAKHPVGSEVSTWTKQKGLYNEIEGSWFFGVEMKPDFSGVISELGFIVPSTCQNGYSRVGKQIGHLNEVNRCWTEGSFIFKNREVY